jgi:alpha-methylacyl-CoA racemase
MSHEQWVEMKPRIAALFRTKSRDEWCALLEGSDCCFAPVLNWDEAPEHPHNKARDTYVEIDGVIQPAPAPRFSRTPGRVQRPPASKGAHTEEVLAAFGLSLDEIERLRKSNVI